MTDRAAILSAILQLRAFMEIRLPRAEREDLMRQLRKYQRQLRDIRRERNADRERRWKKRKKVTL